MKESRCISYKDERHITYDYLKKGKIATILKNISKNSNS